ncbi:MAG: hypothetical protein JNK58_01845 [Phycisphaerae bacterium]|nr:hypothetical protein [Phycisphaerae bacterium]
MINIIAILVGPILAVAVTLWYQHRNQEWFVKFDVFKTLVGNRHRPVSDENVQVLNLIDVVYSNQPRVRELWHEYLEMLGNTSLQNSSGYVMRKQKERELLFEMARSLGFAKNMSVLDLDRIYMPEGLGRQARLMEDTQIEWLRVLKNSHSLGHSCMLTGNAVSQVEGKEVLGHPQDGVQVSSAKRKNHPDIEMATGTASDSGGDMHAALRRA